MDDNFFASDMDNYTINQYSESPYGNTINNNSVDPRLLSSPQNTAIISHETPHEHYPQPNLLSPSYNPFANVPSQQQYFDPNADLSLHSYEPMRHQMLGHRRSVSVPPEDLMPENVPPPPAAATMVFHRGGTPLGDSIDGGKVSGGKKFLKKAALAQKRQMQRHAPYPFAGNERVGGGGGGGGRGRMQYPPQNQGPTSAPQQQQQQQQMAYLREEEIASVMQEFHGSTPSPQFAAFDNVVSPGHGALPARMPMELVDIDALAFGNRSDADTAVLGMLNFTERLSKDCDAMREFLARGFKSADEDQHERYVHPLPHLLPFDRG